MEGMAGAGAFSDGKYNITTEYGGWLPNVMDAEEVLNYIHQADDILIKYGADKEVYHPNNELKALCLQYDLHMQQAEVKHLGTDPTIQPCSTFIHSLDGKVEIETEAVVEDVDKDSHEITFVQKGEKKSVRETLSSLLSAVSATACSKHGAISTTSSVLIIRSISVSVLNFHMRSGRISPPRYMNRRSILRMAITETVQECSASMKEDGSSPRI